MCFPFYAEEGLIKRMLRGYLGEEMNEWMNWMRIIGFGHYAKSPGKGTKQTEEKETYAPRGEGYGSKRKVL